MCRRERKKGWLAGGAQGLAEQKHQTLALKLKGRGSNDTLRCTPYGNGPLVLLL